MQPKKPFARLRLEAVDGPAAGLDGAMGALWIAARVRG